MRRRGVDDLRRFRAKLISKRHGLARRIVRQTKYDEIDVAEHLRARLAVFALGGVDAFDVDALDAGQPLTDFEAGRPASPSIKTRASFVFAAVAVVISTTEPSPMLDALPDRFRAADAVVRAGDAVAVTIDHVERKHRE